MGRIVRLIILIKKGYIHKIDNGNIQNSKTNDIVILTIGKPVYDKDGKLLNKSILILGSVLLNKKLEDKKDENDNTLSGWRLSFGNDKSAAESVYKFFADNISIEFGFLSVPNTYENFVTTSHSEKDEWFASSLALVYAKKGNYFDHSHSHLEKETKERSELYYEWTKRVKTIFKDYYDKHPEIQRPEKSFNYNIYYQYHYEEY